MEDRRRCKYLIKQGNDLQVKGPILSHGAVTAVREETCIRKGTLNSVTSKFLIKNFGCQMYLALNTLNLVLKYIFTYTESTKKILPTSKGFSSFFSFFFLLFSETGSQSVAHTELRHAIIFLPQPSHAGLTIVSRQAPLSLRIFYPAILSFKSEREIRIPK